mgnify:CR=1 FL=1
MKITNLEKNKQKLMFDNTNYIIFAVSIVLIIVGYLLMSGPGSNQSVFNPDIFSTMRIRIAPVICLFGYLLIIVGILFIPFRKKPASR